MKKSTVFGLFWMAFAAFFSAPTLASPIEVTNVIAHFEKDDHNGVRYQVSLTMANGGAAHDRLYAARSLVAERAMISLSDESKDHLSDSHGHREKHLQATAVALPAGETVTLSGTGSHIMLVNPTKVLRSGDTFSLTLFFERAGRINVDVTVTEDAAEHVVDG